jgi:hypothetical protein
VGKDFSYLKNFCKKVIYDVKTTPYTLFLTAAPPMYGKSNDYID